MRGAVKRQELFSRWRRNASALPKVLVLLVLLGTVLRLLMLTVVLSRPDRRQDPDSADYLALAENLPEAVLWREPSLRELSVFHPPGYPAFLAGADRLGGTTAALVLQALLAAVSITAVYALATRLAGNNAGLLAAGLVALEPLSILYSSLVLTEVLFTTVLMSAMWVWTHAHQHASVRLMGAAGLLMGLAALVRPIVLYILVVMVPVTLAVAAGPKIRRAIVAAALVLGFSLPVGAWLARNASVAGGPIFTTVDAVNLVSYRAAGALSVETDTSVAYASQQLTDALRPHIVGKSPYDQAAIQRKYAVEVLVDHPWGTAVSSARGATWVLAAPGLQSLEDALPGAPRLAVLTLAMLSTGIAALLLCGAVLGALISLRRGTWRESLGVLTVATYVLFISAGAEGESRFRVPLVPLFAILSAAALARLLQRRETRDRHRPPPELRRVTS